MYDTVHLWIDIKNTGRILAEELFSNTTFPEEVTRINERGSRTYYQATLLYPLHYKSGQGWDIWLFENGIKIWGSPAKWYFGNNVETLSLSQAEEAFKTLSEALQLPFEILLTARVQRLDFSTVIVTEHPPNAYYDNLDFLDAYNRNLDASGDTLYFKQTEKTVVFYDKTKDAEYKGMIIPKWAIGKNLLRYEVRYHTPRKTHLYKTKKKWLGDVDGKGNLYLKDILNEHIYKDCIDAWERIYKSIKKITKITDIHPNEGLSKASEILESVNASIYAETGVRFIYEMIEARVATNPNLTKRQINTAKRKAKKLSESIPSNPIDHVKELNNKIQEKAIELNEKTYNT